MNFEERARELVSKMTYEEKMSQLRHDSHAIERLGIPAYNWWSEALHGMARSGTATVFPQAIGMAASFDEELLYEVASAVSDEARAKFNEYRKFGETKKDQGITLFSPNINIFRDPRWGRGHETYGEDPCLVGRLGAAYIKGLQGNGKYRKTDATVKHYAVHSGPEFCRHTMDVKVSEKDLNETYLSAFKYCIENADPSMVMGAYNRMNGESCCASEYLNKKLEEFGFNGVFVSDYGAILDFHKYHGATENEAESAAYGLNGGCHLNCGTVYRSLGEAAEKGLITEETVTEAAVKVFTDRFRLGLFDDDCEYDNIPYSVIECEKHRKINRKMAHESMVLLKNDGILPLKKDIKTIAVIGPNADYKISLLGNYNGMPSVYATLLRGIQDSFDGKVLFSEGGCAFWQPYSGNLEEAIIAAKHADAVILCVGITPEMEGEGGDPNNENDFLIGDKRTLDLRPEQQKLVESIVATGKPTVYVNVSGSCMNLSYPKEHCNAIIQCFYPGAEGGWALADILFGKVSPSGRLPITFYESLSDLPEFTNYSMENRTYKFFKGTPVYEFGDGLTYSDITENWTDENTVILKNNGEYDVNYSVLKFEYIPHKSLCDFKKVFIKAGEKVTIEF